MKKYKNLIFIILSIVFALLSYIYIDRGINIKTRKHFDYQVNSDIFYKVNLVNNQDFSAENGNVGNVYIASMVRDIDFTFNYHKKTLNDINGYYNYNVTGTLVAYKDNVKDVVWKNNYTIIDNKAELLNENYLRDIKINDGFKLDYNYYKKILQEFNKTHGIQLDGYLELDFNINEVLEFKEIDDTINDSTVIKVLVPLSSDTLKITVLDSPDSNTSSYYEFSNKERVNYLFLVFGAFCFSVMVANLVLVIIGGVKIYNDIHKYDKELKEITDKYGDILVTVKRFYNKRKYNLIYVDNFNELMDVYNKVKSPITYREVKKNVETIFLITDGDNAWIYRMINEKRIKKTKKL